jgi:hypothetical protein
VASRSRWRLASSTACSALALVVAACGAEEPRLDPAVGEELAGHAADVRRLAERGDAIGAQAEAEELQALVAGAIAAGDVPPELAPELRAGAARLARLAVAAVPPPAAAAPPAPPTDEQHDEEGKGNGKGKDKDEGKGKEGDGGRR